MEKCAKTYDSICRVCLKQYKPESMVSLQEKPARRSLLSYGKVLIKFAKISIDSDGILPSKICQNCKKQIQNINSFKLMCKNNDRILRNLLNLAKNDGEECKKMICEYSIFCQYFPKEGIKKTCKSSLVEPTNDFESDMCNPDDNQTDKDMKKVDLLLDTIEDAVSTERKYRMLSRNRQTAKIDSFLDSIEKAVDIKAKQINNKTKSKTIIAKISKTFHCDICNRTLGNRYSYNYHMQRHTNYQYICDQCGKGFPGKVPLHRHLVKTHDTGPYLQCSHCSFKCSKRFDLVEHIRIHTGERPFTCEKCGLTFRRRAIWTSHLVQHKDKTESCNICQKKFHRQCEVKFHIKNVHERLYLYLCSICKASYASTKSVKKHMVAKHGIPNDMHGKIIRIPNDHNQILMENKVV